MADRSPADSDPQSSAGTAPDEDFNEAAQEGEISDEETQEVEDYDSDEEAQAEVRKGGVRTAGRV